MESSPHGKVGSRQAHLCSSSAPLRSGDSPSPSCLVLCTHDMLYLYLYGLLIDLTASSGVGEDNSALAPFCDPDPTSQIAKSLQYVSKNLVIKLISLGATSQHVGPMIKINGCMCCPLDIKHQCVIQAGCVTVTNSRPIQYTLQYSIGHTVHLKQQPIISDCPILELTFTGSG